MYLFICVLTLCAVLQYANTYTPLQLIRLRRFPVHPVLKLKQISEKIQRSTIGRICYDSVGCFDIQHKRSPLAKIPENPDSIETTFHLYKRELNISEPQTIYHSDKKTLINSNFNPKVPLKIIIHGYMSKWNEPGAMLGVEAYLKIADYNVMLMNWEKGARGPQYPLAAANTEVVGRQLGLLLLDMIELGLKVEDIHLIGFSLGAHVAGCASELLKSKGYLIGRITGLDAASPLFEHNHFRERTKKLDKNDARYVDVIHTDASPIIIDGFGLWQPIGHVDFFPNGGREQPGCSDGRASVVLSHFEKSLTRDIACSHLRAWQLFRETLLQKASGKDGCEFIAFRCPGGYAEFDKGHCFPVLQKSGEPLSYEARYKSETGKLGEDSRGSGVMYLTTRDANPFCGTQLQAAVHVSRKTQSTRGILQMNVQYSNYSVKFELKSDTLDIIQSGKEMNGLTAAKYNTIPNKLPSMTAHLNYLNLNFQNGDDSDEKESLYIDKVIVRDMYGNSWQYCGQNTVLKAKPNTQFDFITLKLKSEKC